MPMGLSGIRNQNIFMNYKLGQTDYRSEQALQTGAKKLQIAASFTTKIS